jgi:hypothetical protein
MTTCCGEVFAIDKESGVELAVLRIPELQIGDAPMELSISEDKKLIRLVYGQCAANHDMRGPFAWNPVRIRPEVSTRTLSTHDLTPSSSNSLSWLSTLSATFPDLETGVYVVGDRNLSFNEDDGRLCLFSRRSNEREWCHTIDPYSRHSRAGPSPTVGLYDLPEGYLVVTDFFGAYLLDRKTGFARWHVPYSNSDMEPQVVDAGKSLIFLPHQVEERVRNGSP